MSARWLAIAKKDFQYARRSNVLLAIVIVFALMTFSIVAFPGLVALLAGEGTAEIADLPLFEVTATAAGFLIPITALVGSYLAVAGERESGRIRLLLGMPPTRRDVVVGKFVARSAVILLAVAVAYGIAMFSSLVLYQQLALGTAVGTATLVGLLGVVFVGIGVGISALAASRARAILFVLAFYFLTVVVWDLLTLSIPLLFQLAFDSVPDWFDIVEALPPSQTFALLYDTLPGLDAPLTQAPDSGVLFSEPVLFGMLCGWIALALFVGYSVFERADLS